MGLVPTVDETPAGRRTTGRRSDPGFPSAFLPRSRGAIVPRRSVPARTLDERGRAIDVQVEHVVPIARWALRDRGYRVSRFGRGAHFDRVGEGTAPGRPRRRRGSGRLQRGQLGMAYVNSTSNNPLDSFGVGVMFLVAFVSTIALQGLIARRPSLLPPRSVPGVSESSASGAIRSGAPWRPSRAPTAVVFEHVPTGGVRPGSGPRSRRPGGPGRRRRTRR